MIWLMTWGIDLGLKGDSVPVSDGYPIMLGRRMQ